MIQSSVLKLGIGLVRSYQNLEDTSNDHEVAEMVRLLIEEVEGL